MAKLLWMIPAFPLAGFLCLVIFGKSLRRWIAGFIGVGSVGLSALVSVIVAVRFLSHLQPGKAYSRKLWTWIATPDFAATAGFHYDALTMVMVTVITVVGFLIHVYSVEYMREDEGYTRFFAYMNLFVGAMLILVMADNLALLYVGWEGVGLCSYLLIGFWYKEPANARAAIKAFLMTRIGDTAMILGILLLFYVFGTMDIQEILRRAPGEWAVGSTPAVLAAALLLGGALGKSAQMPLQTWLPDAMAGPTPVSALIHAATMVTAGVYLIARTNVLFSLAPVVQTAVAVIGAATLLMAGFSAMVQSDIKRVLAYSTMSQIGYMFLALGVGAWSAAMFHFFTHAFFKSLLFLGAGAVIIGVHHEQNMFKLGGLRNQLPLVFWTFVVGAASLAALPLVTDGFYSKDMILWNAWSSERGSPWLWAAGAAGSFITAIYAFRMVYLTFLGSAGARVSRRPGLPVKLPLVVLAVLSVVLGFIETPHNLGDVRLFSTVLETVLPAIVTDPSAAKNEAYLQALAAAACLAGLLAAYIFFVSRPGAMERLAESRMGSRMHRWWFEGWGFDRLYEAVIVRPFIWVATINRGDLVDRIYDGLAEATSAAHRLLALSQMGRVRNYAMGICIGAVVITGIVILL